MEDDKTEVSAFTVATMLTQYLIATNFDDRLVVKKEGNTPVMSPGEVATLALALATVAQVEDNRKAMALAMVVKQTQEEPSLIAVHGKLV